MCGGGLDRRRIRVHVRGNVSPSKSYYDLPGRATDDISRSRIQVAVREQSGIDVMIYGCKRRIGTFLHCAGEESGAE